MALIATYQPMTFKSLTHKPLLIVFSLGLASCVTSSNPPLRDIGQRPPGWKGDDYKKNGSRVGYIWLSPEEGHPFVQQTRIARTASEGLDRIVSGLKSGHAIDSVKHYRVNGMDVADVRCRPLPKTTRSAKFTRFLIFQGESSFDSIMFSGVSKEALNIPEFKQIYQHLGVGDY